MPARQYGNRVVWVDALRGFAIVLMLVYHIIFDFYYFGIAKIDLFDLPLVLFQRFIGVLFLILVGISLVLSERKNDEGYARHFRRGLMLGAVALAITAVTWIYPHDGFITFGIIHLIAASTLIAPLFFRFGRVNAIIGLILVVLGFYTSTMMTESKVIFWLGIAYPGYTALDYYPIIPWFGVVLLGVYVGQVLFQKNKISDDTTKNQKNSIVTEALSLLGRNSLVVYLVHQVVLVGVILAYKILVHA